ncbi:MAG: response regulator [Acidobacteria bacterium]|nr:response regulator [Acidobacteriota bacterium]
MIEIPLIEDQQDCFDRIRETFEQHGIRVIHFRSGEEFLETIREDTADPYSAVLIDWGLPGASGPEIAQELRQIKPYLKFFAITAEDDPDEVARVINGGYFERFLAKRSLDVEDKVRKFVQDLEQAVREAEEVIICRPFSDKPEHKAAYLTLRSSRGWPGTNKTIKEVAERLLDEVTFTRRRTLRDALPTKSKRTLLIENILIARRVIIAEIFNRGGKLHLVEKVVGYEEDANLTYNDPYKMWDTGFKNYCSELCLRPHEFMNSGEGTLPEETSWLRGWCEERQITYAFPIV